MDKKRLESIFRWRKTIIKNLDKIISVKKSSKKADLSSQGQLTMFDMGMEDVKTAPALEEYDGSIDLMEFVNLETEFLGLPITYEPLVDYELYMDIYCTHTASEILELTDKTENIIIIDRLSKIEHRTSEKGNKYCKLFFSQLGETYIYLWGDLFKDKINMMYINSIYIIQITFNIPTKDFDRYSYVCIKIKNIKDVEIEDEYNRLLREAKLLDEIDEQWMIKNRKNE